MKIVCLVVSVLISTLSFAQSADSLRMAALGERLQEYYKAIEREPLDVQAGECDFLIESTSDSLLRQYIALDIYEHFLNSPLMGAENVAVHVYDRWFDTGNVRMKSESDRIAAKVYSEFNRQSLIGKSAPELLLTDLNGAPVCLFGEEDVIRGHKVLYFYDTDCSKCRIESIRLRNLLAVKDYPVQVYAIYAGDDHQKWLDYISGSLKSDAVMHLWDPSGESDFQRKYSVLKTPRIFLVDHNGMIIGRGLDVPALETMLEDIFAEKKLEYGGRESEALFDGIFAASNGRPSVGEVKGIADYIHDRTLGRADTLMFRQMAGDYLYYLASHSGEGYKEGLRYHISKNILNDGKVWKSSDDSLKVLGFAGIMSDLLSKSVPGSVVPDIKVPGSLYTWRSCKEVKRNLRKLKGETNIIIFYTEGCEVCAAQKKAALDILAAADDQSRPESERLSARRTEVFMINIDKLMASVPSLASRLMDSFDLSSLPFVLITDSDGRVVRRYVLL